MLSSKKKHKKYNNIKWLKTTEPTLIENIFKYANFNIQAKEIT